MFQNANAMNNTYTGISGFSNTPTQDFFNQPTNLTNTNIQSIVNLWISDPSQSIFTNSSYIPYYGSIQNWNVSSVTNMSNLFQNKTSFNNDISSWDTSNVTNMSNMFNGATSFNQNISGWNVSNVTNMESMFNGANAFNQDLNSWVVTNVTNMSNMFNNASIFNYNLSSWNVSSVTNMSEMFENASAFNQYIRIWNTNNVTNFTNMFQNANAMTNTYTGISGFSNTPTQDFFNQPTNLTNDNIQSIVNLWISDPSQAIFTNSSYIPYYGSIQNWDVSSVTNMSNLFQNKTSFNNDISSWDTSNITNMSNMFNGATSLIKI